VSILNHFWLCAGTLEKEAKKCVHETFWGCRVSEDAASSAHCRCDSSGIT
jgi:hypothetical protein